MKKIFLKAESNSLTDEFGLFPNELGGGVVIPQKEMQKLSISYSKLYEVFIPRISSRIIDNFEISESAAKIIVRQAFIPLIFCFLDRLVRINKLLNKSSEEYILPDQEKPSHFRFIEELIEFSAFSPSFNQYLVSYVGGIWKLPIGNSNFNKEIYSNQIGYKNNLFRLYRRTPVRIFRKIFLSFLALRNKAKFPSLTMSTSTWAFHHHGFYLKYIKKVNFSFPINETKLNTSLRSKVFSDDLISITEFYDFLDDLGLNIEEKKQACLLLKNFLQNYYPSAFLEEIESNFNSALDALSYFNEHVLLTSGSRDTADTFLLSAAKHQGKFVVDIQHGGYYGYINDMRPNLDLEYPGIDEFISWGWSKVPENIDFDGSISSLPSPWLSEKNKFWAKLKIKTSKEYDFLLMSTKVKRFPEAPQGATLGRIDLIKSLAENLKSLVTNITSNNYTILHKPYNTTTTQLLSRAMNELELIGGENYKVVTKLDKGLTYELLDKCHVVLWDLPGTGFLECLSAGIPTMVHWNRLCVQEEKWTTPFFQELQDVGIIHSDYDSINEEIKKFKKSPKSWLHNPKRKNVVSRFCEQFAWTSKDWPKYWRKYFDSLSK